MQKFLLSPLCFGLVAGLAVFLLLVYLLYTHPIIGGWVLLTSSVVCVVTLNWVIDEMQRYFSSPIEIRNKWNRG